MYAGGQEQIARHRDNEDHQTDIDQNAMLGGIDHFLGGQLRGQHTGNKADIEVREKGRQALFLCQNGGIGDNRAVRDHQKHHIEHKR